jgi:hypothetical protein
MNFTVIPFMLLDVGKSLQGWRTLHYYGIFAVVIPIIAIQLGAGRAMDRASGVAEIKKKERAEKSTKTASANPQVVDIDAVGMEAKNQGTVAQGKIQGHIDSYKKDL